MELIWRCRCHLRTRYTPLQHVSMHFFHKWKKQSGQRWSVFLSGVFFSILAYLSCNILQCNILQCFYLLRTFSKTFWVSSIWNMKNYRTSYDLNVFFLWFVLYIHYTYTHEVSVKSCKINVLVGSFNLQFIRILNYMKQAWRWDWEGGGHPSNR